MGVSLRAHPSFPVEVLAHAYGRALLGDFAPAEELLGGTRDESAPSTWSALLSAMLWHAEPGQGSLPSPAELSAIVRSDLSDPLVSVLACVEAARASLLSLETELLRAYVEVASGLASRGAGEAVGRWAHVVSGLDAVLTHGPRREAPAKDAPSKPTSGARGVESVSSAALLIESTVLSALDALSRGDIDEAQRAARRAARMARTEEFPQLQYFAHLVLARVRRYTGRSHHAVRILSALLRVVPEQWVPWVTWELILAGGSMITDAELRPLDASPFGRAAAGLFEIVYAARRGDRSAFDRALTETREAVGEAAPFREELDMLAAALDPRIESSSLPDSIRAFCQGDRANVPLALSALSAPETDGQEDTIAFVVAAPDRPARRVLGIGAPLAGEVRRSARPGRLETAVSVAALHGEGGVSIRTFFQSVYGFDFRERVHHGALDTLIYRVRHFLDGAAVFERDRDIVRFKAQEVIVVPDPRCTRPLEELLLRVLAREGPSASKDAALKLGISLRSVQQTLNRLLEDGACVADKRGRRVTYRVEDTTFSEPTRTDVGASP